MLFLPSFKPRFHSLTFLILITFPALTFGLADNNLRIKNFKWMKAESQHFDIYYDESTKLMVPRMAHYLEKAWQDVGKTYNYFVPGRTPFFFYSNHNEFEQTNIVSIGEGTGGVTEAFKNRFLIFNDPVLSILEQPKVITRSKLSCSMSSAIKWLPTKNVSEGGTPFFYGADNIFTHFF
jgi:hypothetical protein